MRIDIRFLVVAALMVSLWAFMESYSDNPTPLPSPLSNFPNSAGEWRMVKNLQFDQATLDVLRPTDYLAKRYVSSDGAVADFYVGYHDGASHAGPLHSPKNCLPGAGWYEVSSRPLTIQLSSGALVAVEAIYQQGANTELFLYWFQVGGHQVTNEYVMKLQEIKNALFTGRRDASFIRISVPITDDKQLALKQAESFLKAVYPALLLFLPS